MCDVIIITSEHALIDNSSIPFSIKTRIYSYEEVKLGSNFELLAALTTCGHSGVIIILHPI